jgi:predicted phosphodiesterase
MLWAIGDIHGCYDEMQSLINKIYQKDGGAFIIFLGDLVDRGPHSLKVMRDVREMVLCNTAEVIIGNHDDKLFRHVKKLELGESNIRPRSEWNEPLYVEAAEFMKKVPLYLSRQVVASGRKYTLVHGGIPSGITRLAEFWQGSTKAEQFCIRTRMVRPSDPKKPMVTLAEIREDDVEWCMQYDGRFNHVVYGHIATHGTVVVRPYSTGLDTGCVYGYKLTAMCLDTQELLQVNAIQAYGVWGVDE